MKITNILIIICLTSLCLNMAAQVVLPDNMVEADCTTDAVEQPWDAQVLHSINDIHCYYVPIVGDIDGDGIDKKQEMLFDLPLTKILTYNAELENLILCGSIKNNKDVYIHALLFGVLPEHARKAIKALKAKGIIKNSRLSVSFDAWKANEVQEIEIEDRK